MSVTTVTTVSVSLKVPFFCVELEAASMSELDGERDRRVRRRRPCTGAANSRIGMPLVGSGLSTAAFSAASRGSVDAFAGAGARPRGAT